MRAVNRHVIRLAAACLGLLCAPAAAQAQLTAPGEESQIQFGPFSLYPTLVLADAGKDSNVFNDGRDPKEDYTLTVSSKALLVTRLGLNELMFSVGSNYTWFRQYESERSNNATYALRLNLSASRFKPFVGAFHSRVRSRPNQEIDARAWRLDRGATAGSNLTVTERTALTASATIEDSAYDSGQAYRGNDLAESLSRSGRFLSAGVRYSLTPLTTLIVTGNYQDDRFPQSHIRDAKTYSVTPTFEFSPDAIIRGSASVGIAAFRPDHRELPQYTGPVFKGIIGWAFFDSRTSFEVRSARGVSYSYNDAQPYYLNTTNRANVTQKLLGPLELVGGVERGYLSYRWDRGGPVSALPFARHSDVADIMSGGVAAALRHGFKVAVSVEHTRRRSHFDESLNFDRTRLLSTVTLGS
jgi:Putative beta-barrel porin 2